MLRRLAWLGAVSFGAFRVAHIDVHIAIIITGAITADAKKCPSFVPPASCGIIAPPIKMPMLANAIRNPINDERSFGS